MIAYISHAENPDRLPPSVSFWLIVARSALSWAGLIEAIRFIFSVA